MKLFNQLIFKEDNIMYFLEDEIPALRNKNFHLLGLTPANALSKDGVKGITMDDLIEDKTFKLVSDKDFNEIAETYYVNFTDFGLQISDGQNTKNLTNKWFEYNMTMNMIDVNAPQIKKPVVNPTAFIHNYISFCGKKVKNTQAVLKALNKSIENKIVNETKKGDTSHILDYKREIDENTIKFSKTQDKYLMKLESFANEYNLKIGKEVNLKEKTQEASKKIESQDLEH